MKLTSLEMKIMLINDKTDNEIAYKAFTDSTGRRRVYINSINGKRYTTKTYEQTEARHLLEDILEEVEDA